jgi:hypothetical protein
MHYYRIGQLQKHLYLYVDTNFTHKEPVGFIPCAWFGLVSYPSRSWGCNLLLENGAIYRNVPISALSFTPNAEPWSLEQAQAYNCYSDSFTVIEYTFLSGLKCAVKIDSKALIGHYLFTVAPTHDGFSHEPEQNKELLFIRLNNGRLTVQPTNHIKIEDVSFTEKFNGDLSLPKGLKGQKEIYQADEGK